MVQPPQNLRTFDSLLTIVEALRGPEGCPWDKEQTHQTLTAYAIEEAHELAEAIDADDQTEMIAELGDLLLQVVLHAEIGRQSGSFTIEDVIEAISTKMVRRHPHVFADVQVSGSQEVLKNWAQIKAQEKGTAPKKTDFGIPSSLPALLKAHKIGLKTKDVRFDWSDWKGVYEKVEEEIAELKEALQTQDQAEQRHELGDVLFSVAQLGRHLGIEAEQALRQTNTRFETRYFHMLSLMERDGHKIQDLTQEQMESYWQKAKADLKK